MAEPSLARSVTQAQVAREAGVSRGLVSLALAGSPKVAADTAERIREVAERLGYRVNRSAAALASGRSGLLGLVLPDLRNPFFDFIAVSLQQAAAARGLTLLITLASGPSAPVASPASACGDDAVPAVPAAASPEAVVGSGELPGVIGILLGMRVEGLLLVSPSLSDAQIRALGAQVPVCVIGRASPGGQVDTVRLDEVAAARAVVAHLAQAGASELIYLTPSASMDANSAERGQALGQAAREAGLGLSVVVAQGGNAAEVRERAEASGRAGRRVGVVAHNDVVALDALAALRRGWLRAPLVSYDDTYLAQREEFSLTSVEQPAERMAAEAVRFLCERSGRLVSQAGPVGAGRHVTVEPVLAVRASSQV